MAWVHVVKYINKPTNCEIIFIVKTQLNIMKCFIILIIILPELYWSSLLFFNTDIFIYVPEYVSSVFYSVASCKLHLVYLWRSQSSLAQTLFHWHLTVSFFTETLSSPPSVVDSKLRNNESHVESAALNHAPTNTSSCVILVYRVKRVTHHLWH